MFRRVIAVWLLVASVACASVGCTFVDQPAPSPPDGGAKPSPVVDVEHPPGDAVFHVLSQWVERKKLLSSLVLAQHVKIARENGDLTDDDVKRFTAAFGDATKVDRELTTDDAVKLRSLK